MKTYTPKAKDITREWHVVDAQDIVLGRLSSDVAKLLIGKSKSYFVPHLDCGDYVVITNAEKIKFTGSKLNQKRYFRHSGYPGGLKEEALKDLLARDPLKVVKHSVKGMLPKNKLRDPRLKRLKVFAGENHPYSDKLKKQTTNNKDQN